MNSIPKAKESRAVLGILKLLSNPHGLKQLMPYIFLLMQRWSGCQSLGMRLKEGEDFPYSETVGLSPEFVQLENSLCVRDSQGKPSRDSEANLILECMCKVVFTGRYNPELSFFTERGAFWTNSTSEILKNHHFCPIYMEDIQKRNVTA